VSQIVAIHAREILDSRGRPTVEVDVRCEHGILGRASVPAGASTGKFEARELRDGQSRYDGLGVQKAVTNVRETLAQGIVGMSSLAQLAIDAKLRELDGTPDGSNLGANALLGVSLAVAHAGAEASGMPLYQYMHRLALAAAELSAREQGTVSINVWKPGKRDAGQPSRVPALPVPLVNMISGGKHAGGKIEYQDFMIIPKGTTDYREGLEWVVRVYKRLGKVLLEHGYESALVGDEGGYGPALASAREAAELTVEAIERAGLRPGEQVALALDVAASHFYNGSQYLLRSGPVDSTQMIDYLEGLVRDFPIVSIEDGLAEDDWNGWKELTHRLGRSVWLVGDDLFCTNSQRLWRGIQSEVANSVLIKVNQIGTLSETLRTMSMAHLAGMQTIVSARSGETEDTTIADLAVGTGCPHIKIGCIVRGERLVKYNRLLRIQEELELQASRH